jgi:hypothetical protein
MRSRPYPLRGIFTGQRSPDALGAFSQPDDRAKTFDARGASRASEIDPELELLAQWMDSVFEIPGLGIRFGLDAIVGLIPGVGDTLTSLASLYILNAARRYGVPRVTMARMALNIAIDYICGAVPILGDAFDVYWKANIKNVELLRRHVRVSKTEERRARVGDWLFVGALMLGLIAVLATSVVVAWWMIVAIAHLIVHVAG